jgi:hypothetical protein
MNFTLSSNGVATPEPCTFPLLGASLAALAGLRRRRSRGRCRWPA